MTDVPAACTAVYERLVAAGVAAPPGAVALASNRASATPLTAASARRALMRRDGEDDDDEGGGNGSTAPVKLLGARVKLGDSNVNEEQMNLLWGRENNSFLKQNSTLEQDTREAAKQAKKAERAARKDESRARAAAAATAEADAVGAAADLAAGRANAGTVTYTVTAERKAQDIHIAGFSIAIAGNVLIENADLKLVQGRRYGTWQCTFNSRRRCAHLLQQPRIATTAPLRT